MKKPTIIVQVRDPALRGALLAVKENLEIITGRRNGAAPLAPLAPDASLADAVAKINELLERLQ